MKKTLAQQLRFIVETDALKNVERRTRPIGARRRENSAEHSWQVALTAMLLAEHANQPVNIARVIEMLLVHDIPEVDVGDVFHYDKHDIVDLHARERAAVQRLCALLPRAQGDRVLAAWDEFEARETPESRFAAAVDRFMAFIMNSRNAGGTWAEYAVTARDVLAHNAHIADGSLAIWEAVEEIVAAAQADGRLAPR